MRTHRKFADLPPARRRAVVVAATVQLLLAGAAWWDLARRPEDSVNGPKRAWAAVIAINFIGPLAYFRWGRTGPRARR
ncbi:PLD nuclease N-terminal domain-containing protein [Amycolatopsis benzoatilytica]|uniref:PLD nuclease N-terminal domain-containing protein n=1 Tax=Amycolatopsis benzoatilytica TaxID=346045 RepID=UPI0003612AF7|nr:PLD nuclease N-terminal domain-containing protein [Amycolatopsis benzoatilytica]